MGAATAVRTLEVYFWALVVIGLAAAWGQSQADAELFQVTTAAGVAVTLFGARAFIGHGQGRITALGLFNLSTALFVGFGAIYAGNTQESMVPAYYLLAATLGAFVPQIAITFFGWGKAGNVTPQFPEQVTNTWLSWAGLIALGAAGVAKSISALTSFAPYIEATAFAAITVITVGFFWRTKARLLSVATLFVGALVIMYAEVFHIGTGRLRIVALVCTVGVIISARFQRRAIKWVTIVAIGPALYWLAQDRKDLQESLHAGGSAGRNGLESMLEPIQVFAKLIRAHLENGFPLSYGYNLLSYPAAWLPENVFPDAPQALGYELVKVHAPERYGSGYSVVATSSGEAYFNFGVVGLVLMIPVLVYLLNFLDRAMVKRMSSPASGTLALLGIVFWAMLAGGISDLTWSGQHTLLTRATTRLPLLIALAVIAWMHAKLGAKKKSATVRRIPRVQASRSELPAHASGRPAALAIHRRVPGGNGDSGGSLNI